ncbi:hypothetical protein ACI2KS_03620 [Pseudomonas sp. NPDC087358]
MALQNGTADSLVTDYDPIGCLKASIIEHHNATLDGAFVTLLETAQVLR